MNTHQVVPAAKALGTNRPLLKPQPFLYSPLSFFDPQLWVAKAPTSFDDLIPTFWLGKRDSGAPTGWLKC